MTLENLIKALEQPDKIWPIPEAAWRLKHYGSFLRSKIKEGYWDKRIDNKGLPVTNYNFGLTPEEFLLMLRALGVPPSEIRITVSLNSLRVHYVFKI